MQHLQETLLRIKVLQRKVNLFYEAHISTSAYHRLHAVFVP